jgi:hypothetical protein
MIAYAIMAVPERRANVLRTQRQLPRSEVFVDHERAGPWPTARRAWLGLLRTGKPWCCLIQDDVTLAGGFHSSLTEALGVLPRTAEVVAPYSNRKFTEKLPTGSFARIRDGVWGVCTVFRRDALAEFLKWEVTHVRPEFKHDDSRVAIWMIETGRESWCMVPSIVQHLDGKSIAGNNPPQARQARRFVDPCHWIRWSADDAPYSSGNAMTKQRERFLNA